MTKTIPLFNRFSALAETMPCLSIGNFPTQITPLNGLSKKLGRINLFIKHDNISGIVYGGNKVRKLEFLLADAKKRGAKRVITNGAAGSNHALATALYAKQAGLAATLVLSEQIPSSVVCANLLADAFSGAKMIYEEKYENIDTLVENLVGQYEHVEGQKPYVIPAGGSSPLGAMGYVNAAFELKEQIDKGEIAEPDTVFVPFGTMGTAAGLLLGLKAAGLKSRLVAVLVTPPFVANLDKFTVLFKAINDLLIKNDPSMPVFSFSEDDFTICHDFYEPGYGCASDEVVSAIKTIENTDEIHLDITYSGKAFAAFCAAVEKHVVNDKPLLFWNTKNSRVLPEYSQKIDYHTLPEGFHRYFV
jgi:1-aminocyclopropane-1-carboxylate deaminase/D-cysteine desulfhydrase-like pyridoxal-dependent ACC family enzyme